MDDYRPFGILADDPHNLLSLDARKRIHDAQWVQEAMRNKAVAAAEWAYKSQDRESDFSTYLLASPAYREATLSGALLILQAVRSEFAALGMPQKQFWKIMRDEVEACVNSFELTELDRRWLESEVVWPPRGDLQRRTRTAATGSPVLSPRIGRPPGLRVNGDKLKEIRGKYSQEDFAGKCGVGLKSIERGEKFEKLSRDGIEKIAKFATDVLGLPTSVRDLCYDPSESS